MAVFVLVPGAWHGGWCWKFVRPLLEKGGHQVHAPSLTGLGDRYHLATDGTDLSTHISDIVNLLVFHDLQDVVLVGHSYAGVVITGVAECEPSRIARLIYLDAIVPNHGQSLKDARAPGPSPYDGQMERGPKKFGPGVPHAEAFGLTDPDLIAWAHERLTPQPPKTLTQPLSAPDQKVSHLPRDYVFFTEPGLPSNRMYYEKFKEDASWSVHALPAGHDAMLTLPQALADLLLKITDL